MASLLILLVLLLVFKPVINVFVSGVNANAKKLTQASLNLGDAAIDAAELLSSYSSASKEKYLQKHPEVQTEIEARRTKIEELLKDED